MEMEPTSPQEIAKKIWNIVKTVLFILRKDMISKNKLLILNLHTLLKRGKIAGKAISNLLLHNHHHLSAALSCRSDDIRLSFVSPKEYEFSCSNSPVYHFKRHHLRRSHLHGGDNNINVVEKVFDLLNSTELGEAVASPVVGLPGFGRSPAVRQLRITDSPFPLKDEERDGQVDKAAEEFIKKFYKELKNQKRMMAHVLQSPSPYHIYTG